MAKIGKPRLVKKNLKAGPKTISNKKAVKKQTALKAVSTAPAAKAAAVPAVPASTTEKKPAQGASLNGGEKKVSQKLLETIEKRKAQHGGKGSMLFSRPPGRRGRRPKGMAEYTPEHQEDETYMAEADNTSLEYEAGIRVKSARDENSFNLERFEDYDEELNFDW